MIITSTEFHAGSMIPQKFTCQGSDISPTLHIEGIPKHAVSLVLIMDDPDAPRGTWDHWIVWNLPPVENILENTLPPGAIVGKNSWGKKTYGGPCPPSGTHRYFFKLYALDRQLTLPHGSTKQELEKAMDGHILAKAELIGLYKKS